MFEIAWQEITAKGTFKTKRRAFITEAARARFIDKLQDRVGFWQILAYRN